MAIEFCHIAPTFHLNLVQGRNLHLVLAHLIETDEAYCDFYREEKKRNPKCQIICDNSAFELFKRGQPMYPSEKLVEMGMKIGADYLVMTDFPGERGRNTIQMAQVLAPQFKAAGFKTFFVPQSEIGGWADLVTGFRWAAAHPELIDYVGVSILAAPNAFGVERSNKLQRFAARQHLMYKMRDTNIFYDMKANGQKVHFLGMVDGPNEIQYMWPFAKWIDSWDSSSAVWAGLNGIAYDDTPTGLREGKFEFEVDFNFKTIDDTRIKLALSNMEYIDRLCNAYLWGGKYDKERI